MDKKIDEEKYKNQFIKICKSIYFIKSNSLLKKAKDIDSFKLDHKPLLRGLLIEDELILKFFKMNNTLSLHKVQVFPGSNKVNQPFYPSNERYYYDSIQKRWFINIKKIRFNPSEINFKGSKIFKAKARCLTKISIGHCFIDLIIDNTIIDIKTDVHSKALKKHIKQVFIQAVMFSSFLKSQMKFHESYTPEHMKLIKQPINNIAIYFWRTNEFYKYDLNDLIPAYKFNRLVRIYTLLGRVNSTELRKIMRQFLFYGTKL